ncbi:DUF3885 domain-containing protein [Colwellia sp. BRX9-1]|uniref:DUF3885 domain-containing protein n=1 Tax=Colwellia sp. BRX9-1 TaxID=2759830 RepID=UPI0015F5C642|nr:DUF3885 domain-containing protein [Colwellia sp. BRX9-1]MBA6354197.1 DUF3885 domain-containing protein [Colwellia sp. BRX9-1]
MNSYLDENFPKLKIEKPLFYNWPIGLRFEIGQDELEVSNEYFNAAHERAVSIFKSVFGHNDEIELIYQQYSDGRKKIRKGSFIFKQIEPTKNGLAKYSDVRDIYELDYKSECWKRVYIPSLSLKSINYKNILLSLIHSDFSCRFPSISGECFFINKSKNIIVNLYDDRGMDVISASKNELISLYNKHNDWLLNYDREKMDLVFS